MTPSLIDRQGSTIEEPKSMCLFSVDIAVEDDCAHDIMSIAAAEIPTKTNELKV